jgi:pimeloyl-ACP methyl ester carboxylesterase
MTITTPRPVRETVLSADGTRIAYDQRGQGPVVVLVGGAFSDRAWRGEVALAEALADRFTTVTYDRRGRGDSIPATAGYDRAREVEDLAALAKHVGASYLYGMSSGGVLVLSALAAGVPARKAALYEPPYVSEGLPPADYADRLRALVAADDAAGAARYFLKQVMGVPAAFLAVMKLTPGWKLAVRLAPSLPYDADLMGDFGIPAEFAGITTPTLVVGGGKSAQRLRDGVASVTSAVPGARQLVLPGQNHDPKPAVLASALRDFFD